VAKVRWLALVSLACIALGTMLGVVRAATDDRRPEVMVVPIHGTIDHGMAHLVARSMRDAATDHAKAIVLDVDSFGGLVDAATEIRDSVLRSDIPVYAFVSGRAWSAGALITLAAERITMTPGASIGAAEPIPKSVKTVSALRGEFAATAAQRHRDTRLATAMVDATAPAYKAPNAILTLTAQQALQAKFIDAIALTQREALEKWQLSGARLVSAQYSFAEEVARFATNPAVSGMLLSIGFVGLLIEMQTLHGVAGIIGASALALFFGTHVYAGFSNGLVIGLAVLGLIGILLELHVLPGHGFPGLLGVIALVASVILAFGIPFFSDALQAIAIAIVLSVVAFVLVARWVPRNAFMERLTLVSSQGRDYVASEDHRELLGRSGIAASYLRPAGVAAIDGQRVDVLTEGEFVTAGTAVVVTRVEGARIFVKPEVG
jgi:membrane-bound serine protease (ClpP class)